LILFEESYQPSAVSYSILADSLHTGSFPSPSAVQVAHFSQSARTKS